MEFYLVSWDTACGSNCFNSQRDGILHTKNYGLKEKELFQFPTGWNSTFIIYICKRLFTVSIPNGMEFYHATAKFLSRSAGFQFPTGWNSTSEAGSGIKSLCSFQFPTGWNSTKSSRHFSVWSHSVSIPNGMEFYSNTGVSSVTGKGFNSQRDGILLFSYLWQR